MLFRSHSYLQTKPNQTNLLLEVRRRPKKRKRPCNPSITLIHPKHILYQRHAHSITQPYPVIIFHYQLKFNYLRRSFDLSIPSHFSFRVSFVSINDCLWTFSLPLSLPLELLALHRLHCLFFSSSISSELPSRLRTTTLIRLLRYTFLRVFVAWTSSSIILGLYILHASSPSFDIQYASLGWL